MAALVATRHTTPLTAFIARLRGRDKPAKSLPSGIDPRVALTAAMRKLLTILNAMARTQQRFEPGGSSRHRGVVPLPSPRRPRPPSREGRTRAAPDGQAAASGQGSRGL